MKKGLILLVTLVIVTSLVLTACFPHRPGRHVPRHRLTPALPDLTLLQGASAVNDFDISVKKQRG